MHGQSVAKYVAPLTAGLQAVYTAALPAPPAYWRHSDWLGTVRLDSTPAQTVYFDGGWAPFGETYAGMGTSDRSFTGQTQDTGVGLYDFLFRQYSPTEGRWIVPDPAGLAAVDITNPQTWNRYAYLSNNPLNATDPLGLYEGTGDNTSGGELDCGFGFCPIWSPILPIVPPGGGGGGGGRCEDERRTGIMAADPKACSKPKPKPPATPAPPKQQPTAPCTGGGAAVVAGGTAAAGVVGAGTAVTGTVGAGGFYNSSSGASAGAFASGGAVAYAGSYTAGAPAQPTDLNDRSVAGGFAGAGVGLMFTNAGSAQALQSTTTTWSFDIAFEFGGSIQVSSGNGIWAVSVTIGPGYGVSFTEMNTATAATGGPCGGG